MNVTGRCLCGAVNFSARNVEPEIHACHCHTCQRWFGGPALGVSAGSVEFDGREHVATFDSSEWAERGFCARCGSSLFYRLKAHDQYVLFTGTFDSQDGITLAGEIFIDAKPPGYDFAGDHARLTGEQFWQSLQQPS
jgi:hypothetical protein